MSPTDGYPRVLIVALGRINETDSNNNGLLLRNLFRDWPRERLAQIYSSGDTGDSGAFGSYYKLGPKDRRFGRLFYALKTEMTSPSVRQIEEQEERKERPRSLRTWVKRALIDSGVYELIFAPRLSRAMMDWIDDFAPDVILAQGYNLTFTLLPLRIKGHTGAGLAFFCSDDWPSYLYAGSMGEPSFLRWLIRPRVARAVTSLLDATDIPLAFGQSMAREYSRRYGKGFTVLLHADDPARFEAAQPRRLHPEGVLTIMAIGTFNEFRWPLLMDANESCRLLNERGVPARIALVSSAIAPEGRKAIDEAAYIDHFDDPGNDKLPGYLKGADLLLLAEAFDEGFVSAIRLSISSKAHLFMFSRRPIVVYAHPATGIAMEAAENGWAQVASRRDPEELADILGQILTDREKAAALIEKASEVAWGHHSDVANQRCLREALAMTGSH